VPRDAAYIPVAFCRHCHDGLPANAPLHVTSCRAYGDWRARRKGDSLGAAEADDLTLYAGLCALYVSLRDGLQELPDLT
jgi:hypothetical protein